MAGHRGLLGSALVRRMKSHGEVQLVTRTREQLDLRVAGAVDKFFRDTRPQTVLLAAAKVGGIHANNTSRWEFLLENLQIQNNVLDACLALNVPTVVFFGSSCIYPKLAPQPIEEDALLTGPLEPTNEPYAIAKIAGLKLVEAANVQYGHKWLSLMPTNLYGPGDNFDAESSHVLPGMIRKFHDARTELESGRRATVRLWGTGSPFREFLHVDDVAAATVHLLERGSAGLFNVGSGEEVTIRDLAKLVADTVGYEGPIEWDASRPDGTPRKLLNSAKIRATGWVPRISLRDGLASTYDWFRTRIGVGADRALEIVPNASGLRE